MKVSTSLRASSILKRLDDALDWSFCFAYNSEFCIVKCESCKLSLI